MLASVLEATFVRRRGGRDRVYVTRTDATSTGWDFPSYGDGLPHDLCHLVVEDELGLKHGFWGLVDQGVEVRLVKNQATLILGGTALAEHANFDFTGLMEAEAAVALLAGPAAAFPGLDSPIASSAAHDITEQCMPDLPATAKAELVAAINRRLRTLAERWRVLDDGGGIRLAFGGCSR